MKINFSPISFNYNQIKKNSFSNTLERTPKQDTVSFSRKKEHQKVLKPRVQAAVDYSQQILQKANDNPVTLEDIKNITSQYSDNVTIHPMSELHRRLPNLQNYGAFFLSQMNSEFRPSDKEMFINLPKSNADEMRNLLFAMNCSHEFTHIEQMDTNEAFNQLKTMSKGDYEVGKAIMGIGDTIFEIFDTQIQARTVAPLIYKSLDVKAFDRYGEITPVKAPITRQMLPTAFGVKSENDMQKQLRNTFGEIFENTMISIHQNQPEILDMIPENETYESLMKKVRSYCAIKAKDEREAYTTESEVAKKAMGTTKSLNIDAFPFYYDILVKAFE